MVYRAHLSCCSALKPFTFATPSCVFCVYWNNTFLSGIYVHIHCYDWCPILPCCIMMVFWILHHTGCGLSAIAVNNVYCCILMEEPHNSNIDSAYTDSFPIFVEGFDMVMLRTFATIDNMTWGGWETGLYECWVLN